MLSIILSLLWASSVAAKCYEPSEAHPLPDLDPNDFLLKDAFTGITTALDLAVAGPEFASTSFSVEVTSSKKSLWSHHHTALERNASRPCSEASGDALYRIASITKTFTVLGILYQHAAGNLSLDDPIDKYIEELKGEQKGTIPWKDITLRSLASQLSGIPRDFAQDDIINPSLIGNYIPEQLGFPPVTRDGLLECDEYAPNYKPACGPADLMKALKSYRPLFAPNQESTYSNLNYELLGLALANVTNQTYEDYITDAIFKPLNMTKSTLSLPPDSAGVIPLEPQYWDIDEGVQNPTGGIYSSTTDLSKFLRYVLTHYNGITHAINWIHPVSPARGLHSFYGMPWEIFQTDRILKNSKRTVKMITKAGGLPGYISMIITIPQYDLGITILVAGNFDLFFKIQEAVTVGAVRAAEQVSIQQLHKRYAGTYASTDPDLNSTVTLVADHRGLIVTDAISNSTDLLSYEMQRFFGAPSDGKYITQIVPTLLYKNETEQSGELWRIQTAAERPEGERPIWEDFCMSNVDGVLYAGVPIGEVIFWGKEGEPYDTLELTGFRVKLARQEDEDIERNQGKQEMLEL